jgi:hypothetical protein
LGGYKDLRAAAAEGGRAGKGGSKPGSGKFNGPGEHKDWPEGTVMGWCRGCGIKGGKGKKCMKLGPGGKGRRERRGRGRRGRRGRRGKRQQSCGWYRLSFTQAKELFLGPDWAARLGLNSGWERRVFDMGRGPPQGLVARCARGWQLCGLEMTRWARGVGAEQHSDAVEGTW